MFYKLNTIDVFGTQPWKRSPVDHGNGTFGGDMNMFARATDFVEQGADFRHESPIEDSPEVVGNPAMASAGDLPDLTDLNDLVSTFLPDG